MGGAIRKSQPSGPTSHSRLIESDGSEEFRTITNRPDEQKLPYPRSVFYILTTEFCERFSYYGLRTVLSFYLKYRLLYTEDASTVLYHSWSMLCYFTPILGALLADLALGRYRTILYMSLIYLVGNVVLALSAAPPVVPTLTAQNAVAVLGLVLVAIGTGGIKPCVSAFGGEQFTLPQQESLINQYFSIFYFSINLGSLLSTVITPVLREDTTCFNNQCYFAAFGLPAVLMGLAVVAFVSGSPTYKKAPASGTVLTSTASCIWMGAVGKVRSMSGRAVRLPHWLDHARARHGDDLVEDVRVFTSVVVLFLPLPFFWALFDQQGSRWTFQAARMDGKLGSVVIQPDQVQVMNPLLILLLVPVLERWGYPLLARVGWLTKPLQRVTAGGVLAAMAFAMAAVVESRIQSNIASGEPPLSMMWLLPQYFTITLGEVFFSISGLLFAFNEAPASMKSVMQAAWLLTISFGNLIVVLVAQIKLLDTQTEEFTLFTCLMLLDMILFGFMAYYYKPYKPPKPEDLEGLPKLNGPPKIVSDSSTSLDSSGVSDRHVSPEDDPTLYSYDDLKNKYNDYDELHNDNYEKPPSRGTS